MRLAKHVTLPLEDAVSFKDSLDKRIDKDLKKIYITAGSACKQVLALWECQILHQACLVDHTGFPLRVALSLGISLTALKPGPQGRSQGYCPRIVAC